MKNILITGGFGFVGGRLTKKLSGHFTVTASSRKTATPELLQAHGGAQQVRHNDVLSKENFPKDIDTVIHLAALNEWDCVKYPSEAIRVNIDETRVILENSIAHAVKQFIYFSTAHIYKNPLQGVIDENILPVPTHPYAITHKAAEDYVVAATLQKKIQGIVVRLSNSFGAPVVPTVNRWTLLANDLCRQAVENEKLVLLSNGCQYRDFICLSDVEDVVLAMVREASFKKIIYNLGAGTSMRVIDMANAIVDAYAKMFNKSIHIELPAGAEATDEPTLTYKIDKLLSEGCKVRNEFDRELQQLLSFCAKNFIKTA